MEFSIERAERNDLPVIIDLQYLAFQKEAEDFNDFQIEPLTQTLENIREEFKNYVYLKALDKNGNIIGSTRGYIKDNASYIGKTFVHPNFQGNGIGTRLINSLESINKAPRYEINASIRCPQNIRLYEKLGYVRFKEVKTENNRFVYLEKFI